MQDPALEIADLPIGAVRFYKSIPSTNDEAARWAAGDAPDMALVIANEQTEGRGRLNRRWYTPADSALAFSVILRQTGQINAQINQPTAHITALGALAVCDALKVCYHLPAHIKWPNDVLVGSKKICGILAEAQWFGETIQSVVLGIGINILRASLPPPSAIRFPATCLEEHLKMIEIPPIDAMQVTLLRGVIESLVKWRSALYSQNFVRAWEDKLAYRGEWVVVYQDYPSDKTHQHPPLAEGKLLGINTDGALQLADKNGNLITLQTGELHVRELDQAVKIQP